MHLIVGYFPSLLSKSFVRKFSDRKQIIARAIDVLRYHCHAPTRCQVDRVEFTAGLSSYIHLTKDILVLYSTIWSRLKASSTKQQYRRDALCIEKKEYRRWICNILQQIILNLPIHGHGRILRFSLATMLHLWLLVIQSQRSKLYGATFSIMMFFFYGTAIRGYSQKIRGYSLECPGLTTRLCRAFKVLRQDVGYAALHPSILYVDNKIFVNSFVNKLPKL